MREREREIVIDGIRSKEYEEDFAKQEEEEGEETAIGGGGNVEIGDDE